MCVSCWSRGSSLSVTGGMQAEAEVEVEVEVEVGHPDGR